MRKVFILTLVAVGGLGVGGCLMNVDQEIHLGKQAAPGFEAESGGPYPSELAQAYVARVGNTLVAELTPEERTKYEFSFTLLNSGIINAFALPGGPIFISRGLLVEMQSEDDLAGVLGHEIGHVVHRHTAYRIQRAQGFQLLLAAIGVGLQVGGGPGYVGDVSGLIVQLTDLKYGRDDESESDMSGVVYMVRAGYDPRGMISVMKILKSAGGGATPEFFSTHPDPDNRLVAISEAIGKRWPQIQAKEPVFREEPFQKMLTASLLSAGSAGGYAAYDEAERLRIQGLQAKTTQAANQLFTQAEQAYTSAIKTLPGHALPYIGRAKARWRLNRLKEALLDVDAGLAKEPDHHDGQVTRAFLRLADNNNRGALEDADHALKQVASHAYSYFYRGKALYRLRERDQGAEDLQTFLGVVNKGPDADETRQMLRALGVQVQ